MDHSPWGRKELDTTEVTGHSAALPIFHPWSTSLSDIHSHLTYLYSTYLFIDCPPLQNVSAMRAWLLFTNLATWKISDTQ